MNSRLPCCCLAPLLALPLAAQDEAATWLAKLDLEQKAGQLFVSWSLSRPEGSGAQNHEKMLGWVRDAGLGGVILSLGTVEDAANLIPKLQAAAKVPLLLAGDFEGGVWFRLSGATELGNQMLVGASGSAALAEAMGKVTAQEAKALGFHWVLAPVLDVNSNPKNPIINVRSFGEDPALVAKLGAAFARGVRSEGLVPCGKHFPGHGDVDTDSHLALPTVPGDGARLRQVELLPFQVAAKQGLESVMTGHLAVPGLGEAATVPATLSKHILGDVLREELGFRGLVVTDALGMGGVKNAFAPGEVAVQALLAGADVLLMPPDPLAARAAVIEAVKSGRVPMARLDDAVMRILSLKARVGLLAGGGAVAPDWQQQLHTKAAERLADEIAVRGLTLVRDRGGLLPLAAEGAYKTVLVTVLDENEGVGDEGRGAAFASGLGDIAKAGLRLSAASTDAEIAAAVQRVRDAKRVVLALHVAVRSYSGSIGLPPALRPVVQALQEEQQVIAVSFGNPYLVQQWPCVDTYLCAFVSTPRVEAAAAAALRGAAPIRGRLPVTIPGVAAAGTGLTVLPGNKVEVSTPAAHDLDPALPGNLRALLERAVADRAFPGAVCLVARGGELVAEVAVGKVGYAPEDAPVALDTLWDLASLTKVCATTPAVLRLVAAGKLSLDESVQNWLPQFTGTGKEIVTVRHLLAHNAGLPAFRDYYRTLKGKAAIVRAATAEDLTSEPGAGVTYSDVGFVLLMQIVELCSGELFEAFVQHDVFDAFGMTGARFVPTDGPPAAAAPTEDDPARGGIVRGFVHDENAFAMGGISGHAGMFATAHDVLRFGVAMLAGGRSALPRELVAMAIRPAGFGDDTTRGLGFQLFLNGGQGGTVVPSGTFGHTGFTGTSLWCDPQHDLCVVLLSNRVHPTRVNNRILGVRKAVHDLVLGSLR
jgi:beta-glucosidase-like glycosyl hydrolase/CubicO group peptidase (beta-lactamase class C family)